MRTTAAVTAVVAGLALGALTVPAAAGEPQDHADHGHLLLLGVEVLPGSFPPVPSDIRSCVDLAAGQAVPRSEVLHVDFDGGRFTARTGNVIVPVWPYATQDGLTIPWHDCAEFTALFGLD